MDRQPITPEWRAAIKAHVKAQGVHALANKAGVGKATVYRWVAGQIDAMDEDRWRLVAEAVEPYLVTAQPAPARPAPVPLSPNQPLRQARPDELVKVPVIGMALACGIDTNVALSEWVAEMSNDETAQFTADCVRESCVAIRVEGQSMAPLYPHGTLLLVDFGLFAERGDLVVARLADMDEVVVKVYDRHNSVVTLAAVNPDGQSFEIDLKAEPGRLLWVKPVIEVNIRPRAQRKAALRMGNGGNLS